MKARSKIRRWLVVGLGLAALAAPVGQAANGAVRPSDDRVDLRVVGTPQVAADSPDIVSRYLVSHPAVVRPSDDRVDFRVVGTGKAGIATPAPDQGRSFWGAAELAAAGTLGALAVALAGFALIRHRRSATAVLQG
jgi:hypothetical protein